MRVQVCYTVRMTRFIFHWLLPAATTLVGVLLITMIVCIGWDTLYGHHKDERND